MLRDARLLSADASRTAKRYVATAGTPTRPGGKRAPAAASAAAPTATRSAHVTLLTLVPATPLAAPLTLLVAFPAEVVRPQLQAACAALEACAEECERPAGEHEHCQACAESCREADQALHRLMEALG